ncbi:hypothetical protein C8P63_1088 [Melghirimyces profundicolus]|uniref:Uncharacterized protein n=1 Tax=Melghirimyces profundicolus TaxID=1242148 RepID=A0A2T6BX98_9BACL|nr:hypothetical protein [Melghirimyces profundicolus]PTX60699.1 hypothetical protein C8P63_1088 [Melghirimyces profundicolus]
MLKRIWDLAIFHKKKVIAGAAAITLLSVSPALARFSDEKVLPALSENNIFGLLSDLQGMTGEMVEDTKELEDQVTQAENAMQGLDRQEALLKKQINTNEAIKDELDKQLSGNVEARGLMEAILKREKQTAKLTDTAAAKGNEVTAQMTDTVASLGVTADYTGKVGNATAKTNSRMDLLLAELDRSVENFRYVALVPQFLSSLNNLPGLDSPDTGDDKNPPTPSSREVIDDTVNSLTGKESEGQQDEEDGESNGLLSDLLP